MNRRTFLFTGGAAVAARRHAKIAAAITAYYRNSHADVFVGNMLRGFCWEGKPHASAVDIVAMYLAQTPATDIGRAEAASRGIALKASVGEAIVPGIQGVALIGEHGDYPLNEKGQKLYPRYELMEQIVSAYRRTGRALPLFFDKHFSTEWKKAKQIFDWSQRTEVSPDCWDVADADLEAAGARTRSRNTDQACGRLLLRRQGSLQISRPRNLPEHGGAPQGRGDRN